MARPNISITTSRQGLSDLDFNGGYVQAAYTITGEMRHYDPGCGCYGSIVPAHPFSLKESGWGAWEGAARYSVVDLNDAFNSGTTVTSTNGFAGGMQDAFTLAVNWYVNTNIRFMLDYIHAIINKMQAVADAVPLRTSTGATMDAIALRTQVAF
ncbi:MAG TPA: porin [Stellaceae bacterium]|nr:porin [Stellaceae bacterium]